MANQPPPAASWLNRNFIAGFVVGVFVVLVSLLANHLSNRPPPEKTESPPQKPEPDPTPPSPALVIANIEPLPYPTFGGGVGGRGQGEGMLGMSGAFRFTVFNSASDRIEVHEAVLHASDFEKDQKDEKRDGHVLDNYHRHFANSDPRIHGFRPVDVRVSPSDRNIPFKLQLAIEPQKTAEFVLSLRQQGLKKNEILKLAGILTLRYRCGTSAEEAKSDTFHAAIAVLGIPDPE